ncbi:hypothetical protein DPMN_159208 [Dreissena polymorpha]|uniref:Uncharacterized protein n=1 Tax=Dreissena polymorpha TaxID=45954 RepID=A0A9D4EKM7_DREPO|nr:hypothetical protein DPMN_159208 [Dreissena polymorpha]
MDTQCNLSVTRPVNGEPDLPLVHRNEVSSLSSGCTCQARSRRGCGPSSPCRPIETKAEEEFDRGPSQRQRYNTATLKDTWEQEEFKVTRSNKFQVLKELLEQETI